LKEEREYIYTNSETRVRTKERTKQELAYKNPNMNAVIPKVPKLSFDEECEEVAEADFSQEFLEHYLETDDLSSVTYVEMQVDAESQSIEALGAQLTNLQILKLNGSQITCVRDLGTSLSQLRVLWLTRVGLATLDGISVLDSLQELYVAFNNINDLSPLMYHELEFLDLEGNCLDSIQDAGSALASCPNLIYLNICNNPCSKRHADVNKLKEMLPNIDVQNDDVNADAESTSCSTQNLNDLNERDKEIVELDEQDLIVEGVKKSRRIPTGTSLSARPSTAHPEFRPLSRGGHPVTAPAGGRPRTSLVSVDENTSSSSTLTIGPPLAGNALQAIRLRRKEEANDKPDTIQEMLERYKCYTQESYLAPEEIERRRQSRPDVRPGTPDVQIRCIGRPGTPKITNTNTNRDVNTGNVGNVCPNSRRHEEMTSPLEIRQKRLMTPSLVLPPEKESEWRISEDQAYWPTRPASRSKADVLLLE